MKQINYVKDAISIFFLFLACWKNYTFPGSENEKWHSYPTHLYKSEEEY